MFRWPLAQASVKPENQYKKSSETLDNIKLFTYEVLTIFLRKEIVEIYQNPILFLLPSPSGWIHKNIYINIYLLA